jgi:hypothetical protein
MAEHLQGLRSLEKFLLEIRKGPSSESGAIV